MNSIAKQAVIGNFAHVYRVGKRRQDLSWGPWIAAYLFPAPLCYSRFCTLFFFVGDPGDLTWRHAFGRHREHGAHLLDLFRVDHKLFGQRIGIIAQGAVHRPPACPAV